jgi:hypothetical protein
MERRRYPRFFDTVAQWHAGCRCVANYESRSVCYYHSLLTAENTGKTVLSSQVIDRCKEVPNSNTMFFHCIEKDPTKNNFLSIVKSLISQALHLSQDDLLPQCYERLKKHGAAILQAPKESANLLESCLQRLAQSDSVVNQQLTPQRQYVIIDGLDECEDNEWSRLLEFFRKTVHGIDKTHFGRLRIMLVSQHTPQIEKALRSDGSAGKVVSVSLEQKDNRSDIELYVQRRARELRDRFGFLDNVETDKIIREICQHAAGMYQILLS